MTLLHAHAHAEITFGIFAEEVLLHSLIDVLKLLPILFLTYLLMEFIEHRASDKTVRFIERSGTLAPVVGAAAGLLPQCGFSVSAANLYTGRVISVGTLIAVFLATSDEMIPIMISGNIRVTTIIYILLYKFAVAAVVGILADFVLRLFGKRREPINIDEICDEDNCHCERGIFYSALHHTLTITAFVAIVTLVLNSAVFFIGEERIGELVGNIPVLSHFVAALVGLIPNCAASVVLSTFCAKGIITSGAMLAGLFSGAGVGVLVLFRVNKNIKTNLMILGALVCVAVAFGLLADALPFLEIVRK